MTVRTGASGTLVARRPSPLVEILRWPVHADRREDLLAAGLRVFRARGVGGATVAAIAAEAGTAKGNVYRYFDSKEALLAALKGRFLDELAADALRLTAGVGTDDWGSLADAFVAGMIDFMLERADLVWVFAADPGAPSSVDPFRETEAQIVAVIADGIRAGVAAGAFDVDDPDTTAFLLEHALSTSVEHLIVYGDGDIDRDRLVAATQQLARRALGLSPSRAPSRRRRATASS
jgi:AcrR family transcriptional regulator